MRDANSVFEDRCVDIVIRIDVDAPHELHDPARFSQVVAAGFIKRFADEVKGHLLTFPYFRYEKVSILLTSMPPKHDFPVLQVRESSTL
ncbi:hypothetical protein [Sinorhizobium medicae]|uniref:hypothetical protein n=1 Tax=Sinorhizobium medicae TaxID=110321 RepID=UPI002B1BE09B|nr:hypothetical protein [Sinorhizobium medicae]WQO47390.1 hypothetical protein U8C42_02500 [Sinorhizobium medicae]